MTGPRTEGRRGMITPGPRTQARRERAARMRATWESLTPEVRATLLRFPRADRQRMLRAVLDDTHGGDA